ncbi:MAG: hypothetical protein AAF802_31660, partial [Planctomycetota bacterium]
DARAIQPASAAQAAWRFYGNPDITLQQVFSPILGEARTVIPQACQEFVLVACDWCKLHYKDHHGKKGRIELANSKDLGYEMFTGLAMDDRDGRPIAPLWIELRDQAGIHSTRDHQIRPAGSVLDEIVGNLRFVQSLALERQAVFIIDCEADSIWHLRQWHAQAMQFVVRGKAWFTVMHEGKSRSLKQIGDLLHQGDCYLPGESFSYRGQEVRQWIAETEITITRPARQRRQGQKEQRITGEPLTLRLVVAQLRSESGEVVACWYLYTNVSASVLASTVACWYSWRWRIEDYHKLLKSAGHELENWGQESCEAIARRLAVASMACVMVWRLQHDESESASAAKDLLVRLSGRRMGRGRRWTAPSLLAGLWILLSLESAIAQYGLDTLLSTAAELRQLIASNFT